MMRVAPDTKENFWALKASDGTLLAYIYCVAKFAILNDSNDATTVRLEPLDRGADEIRDRLIACCAPETTDE